jgi:Family of unknown function (DUF5677)
MGTKVEPNPDRSRRQNLPLQLEIADKLLRFVETTTTEPQTPANLDPRRSCILMSLGAKTFATFQSVQALLKLGMYEDASALVRVMYESAMIATFLAHAANDQTVDDYADYFMLRNWRDQRHIAYFAEPRCGHSTKTATRYIRFSEIAPRQPCAVPSPVQNPAPDRACQCVLPLPRNGSTRVT